MRGRQLSVLSYQLSETNPRAHWKLKTGNWKLSSAFTLIEVLVVMTIIVILLALFIAGYKQWSASAARANTSARIESLNGMLAFADSAGHNQFVSQWFFPSDLAAATPGALALDAEQFGCVAQEAEDTPEVVKISGTNKTVGNCSRMNALAYMTFAIGTYATNTYPAPASFSGSSDWFYPMPSTYTPTNSNNQGIYYGIMTKLAVLPGNSASLSKLPSNEVTTVAPVSGSYTASYPTATITLMNPNPPPVVLDGWGNPILFCPGSGIVTNVNPAVTVGGLTNVYLNTTTGSSQGATTITSPDGRPFWVSAGPDGDFARGDDNIYSFNPQ
jgi:prepilin-type N-terminal cleavage/methylation domain-containing protein